MGADLVMIAVPITKTREEALAELNAMPFTELLDRCENNGSPITYWVEGSLYDEEGPDGESLIDEHAVRERCREAVNITYDAVDGEYRLASALRLCDNYFAVAGGPSWGDAPEFVDDLEIASALQVTYDPNKVLKWVDK